MKCPSCGNENLVENHEIGTDDWIVWNCLDCDSAVIELREDITRFNNLFEDQE